MVESVVLIYFTQNITGSFISAIFKDFYLIYTFCGNLDRLLTWKRSKIKKEKNISGKCLPILYSLQ